MTTATIVQDRMGNLQVWKGKRKIHQVSKYLWHNSAGEQSDVYFQTQDDVEQVLGNLPAKTRTLIENGWPVTTTKFNEEYFPNN